MKYLADLNAVLVTPSEESFKDSRRVEELEERIRASLRNAPQELPNVLLDLSRCDFLGSWAVGMIVRLARDQGSGLGTLALLVDQNTSECGRNPQSGMMHLMKVLKLDQLVTIFGSVEDATPSLKP